MPWEAAAAALVGLAVLVLVLEPLLSNAAPPPAIVEPDDPEETARGRALAALREIEFDRQTGKLADDDYALLKAKYSGLALAAIRAEHAAGAAARPSVPDDHLALAEALVARRAAAPGERAEPTH